jgi:predicted transcriptional regulator
MNENFTTSENVSFNQAIKKLNDSGVKCLVIVDDKNRLLGTLSDGDIRRCLFRKINVKSKITKFYNKNSIFSFL